MILLSQRRLEVRDEWDKLGLAMPKMSPLIRGPQDVVSSSREAEASPRNEVCWMLGEVFLAFLG